MLIEIFYLNSDKMPEGGEVRRIAFVLNQEYAGLMCHSVMVLPKYRKAKGNDLYSTMPIEYEQHNGYKQVNIGIVLSQVVSKGKKIIFEFSNSNGRFVSGLGLNGIWSMSYSPKTAVIVNFEGKSAFYEETYIGGNFSICMYGSLEWMHIFKDVGPDIMSDEVTYEVFDGACKNPRIQNMTVYDFLMNQKYLSGCGNWVTADVLFKCRINPKRPMSHLSDQDVLSLFNWSKKILWDSYNSGGLTIRDYVDPLGQIGSYVTDCYGRDTDVYGNAVVKEENKTGRKMHYSPIIQPW